MSLFFGAGSPTDLRWNHYLYLLVQADAAREPEFAKLKCSVEGDRTYARKAVLTTDELVALLSTDDESKAPLPIDVERRWTDRLDTLGLAYILDESISAPEAARLIRDGKRQSLLRSTAAVDVSNAEKAAGQHFLQSVELSKFRAYPTRKFFDFGDVNLIVGRNGSGKTSLLEAIEYLYCGDNKRQPEVAAGRRVVGRFGPDAALVTSSTTSLGDLRSRNSVWYAKADVKKVTLCDSFGKFNFLDTDAAVDLSRNNDSEDRLRKDVGRLLLGEEAEKLATKISRVAEKVEICLRDLARDMVDLRRRVSEAKARIAALANVPKESDSIFKSFLETLNQIGWRSVPISKEGAVPLGEEIQSCATAITRLHEANLGGTPPTAQSFMDARDELSAKISEVARARDEYVALQQDLVALSHRESGLRTRFKFIKEIHRFAENDFWNRTKKLDELKARIAQQPNLATEMMIEAFLQGLPSDALFVDAGRSISERQKRCAEAVHSLRITVQSIGSTIASLRVAKQEVLSSAKSYMELASDTHHCPVCCTHFPEGNLLATIELAEEDAGTELLSNAQAQLQAAEAAAANVEEQAASYRNVALIFDPPEGASVLDVLGLARRAQQELRSDSFELQVLEQALTELASRGLTHEALLSAKVGAGVDDITEVVEVESLLGLVERELFEISVNKKEVSERMSGLKESISMITAPWSSSDDEDMSARFRNMENRVAELDVLASAIALVQGAMNVGDAHAPGLVLALDTASSLHSRLVAALGSEAVSESNLRSDVGVVSGLEAQLVVNQNQAKVLRQAADLFDELLEESRSGSFANQVISENAASIAKIFEEIHAPNEFDVRISNAGDLVIYRNGGEPSSLKQMSTGQRAAYALSLFLAMNKNLNVGPPVILLDDPVAHVDDLNILSFLDYLRELAVSSSRQIFFATADDKIAGLFRQKFRFLGESRFRDIELRRDLV